MREALGAFYEACDVVLSPSAASDARLRRAGRRARAARALGPRRRHRALRPAHAARSRRPGRIDVLYAGRQTLEKGVDLLADSFLEARRRDPRLHLVLAGGGPEEQRLRERLGDAATFLGWLAGDELAVAYASADMMLFCSQTDTFGQVILEAQASGLPVVAVGRRRAGRADRVRPLGRALPARRGRDRRGRRPPRRPPGARERLAAGGLAAVRERTWDAALGRLGDGWRRALAARRASERQLLAG